MSYRATKRQREIMAAMRAAKERKRFMHRKAGRYYYVSLVDGKSKWIPLGDNYAAALAKWAELEGKQLSGETVADAINRYTAQILPELSWRPA